jgi:hypothetical protein
MILDSGLRTGQAIKKMMLETKAAMRSTLYILNHLIVLAFKMLPYTGHSRIHYGTTSHSFIRDAKSVVRFFINEL